ncbi:hypothetical protein CAPTEDRAFT_195134 [Capitella teleta]|uniref:Uncharacterized protein n=1 Tax=Capitella teleta TaxID=283909 RepID=R7VDH6_CAPTE|nr:hypothetical protein CAPTEDRAFT_195134 [Capitella teleta]|eukprot:ELU16903.1 hypothetical protein CAPTEDRAFT_195134 [Capitella teleta]
MWRPLVRAEPTTVSATSITSAWASEEVLARKTEKLTGLRFKSLTIASRPESRPEAFSFSVLHTKLHFVRNLVISGTSRETVDEAKPEFGRHSLRSHIAETAIR